MLAFFSKSTNIYNDNDHCYGQTEACSWSTTRYFKSSKKKNSIIVHRSLLIVGDRKVKNGSAGRVAIYICSI